MNATHTRIGRGSMGRMLKRWQRAGSISGFAYVHPIERQGAFALPRDGQDADAPGTPPAAPPTAPIGPALPLCP